LGSIVAAVGVRSYDTACNAITAAIATTPSAHNDPFGACSIEHLHVRDKVATGPTFSYDASSPAQVRHKSSPGAATGMESNLLSVFR